MQRPRPQGLCSQPPQERGMREPWFAIAVFAWAFATVAVPHVLIEQGTLPPAVAEVISALRHPMPDPGRSVGQAHAAAAAPAAPQAGHTIPAAAAPMTKVPVAAPDDASRATDGKVDPPAETAAPAAPVPPGPDELAAGEAWSDLYELGHDLLRTGRLQDAIAALKGAAELNPGHAAIRHDLGYTLQKTGDADGAIEHYGVAISLDPEDQLALYNLAFLLHRAGRFEEALPLYAQAVRLFPDDPYIAFNYAALLEGRGEVDLARLLFKRAAAVGGATKIAGDARARLAQLEG